MDTLRSPRLLRPVLGLGALLGLATPTAAFATEAVVPPLISNGVDPLIVLNMTSLISSEMDFMSEFDAVTQLDTRPASFNGKCLGSSSCLAGVARSGGGDALVGGAVSSKGNKFDLFLVYVKGGKIVRTKEYTVANVPSVIADSMGGYVRELVTGVAPEAAAAAATGTVDEDFFDDEMDDFAIGAAAGAGAAGVSRRIATPQGGGGSNELDDFDFNADPEEEARKARAAEEARRRQEEERRAAALAAQREREAAERREREEQARRQREEEERRRREEEAAAAAALAAQQRAEEEEEDDLAFGEADIMFAPVPMELEDEPPPPEPEPRFSPDDGYADLDEPVRRSKPERAPREPRERKERAPQERTSRDLDRSDSGGGAPTAVAAARIGYANFQGLSFVTYGAEVSFLATDKLAIIAGVEAYSTRRAVPEDLQEAGAPPEVWNTILPFNIGLAYRFLDGNIQPYAGGDVVLIPGYVKDASGLATGLRLRGGSDFMVTDSFGFNLNLSLGIWAGQNFESVETATTSAAITPQFSGGTVLHF